MAPPRSAPVEQCQQLEGRWAGLEQACESQAQGLQQAVALRQVRCREHRVRGSGRSQAGSVRELCGAWGSGRWVSGEHPGPGAGRSLCGHRSFFVPAAGERGIMSPRGEEGSCLRSSRCVSTVLGSSLWLRQSLRTGWRGSGCWRVVRTPVEMRQPPPGTLGSARYHVLSVLHTFWAWVMMGREERV